MSNSLPLTTKKFVPSAVRCPTPARINPVTVSSSPITPISFELSLIIFFLSFDFVGERGGLCDDCLKGRKTIKTYQKLVYYLSIVEVFESTKKTIDFVP
jgi:hypothetical protein